jgi:UDP-GlcNAc3NAcA epimerase
MKLVTILGARPQFIKAGTFSRELSNHKNIEEVIVHTGQHFDENMSDVFFNQMLIPKPKYNLDINNQSHGAMTGKMLEEIELILLKEKPDWVIVYGDTNSTLAGALAATKLHIKIVHIEAGLRSFNMDMPEEVNRILTDRISSVLCCPTQVAVNNLINEGYSKIDCSIINTGDIMFEGAIFYRNIAERPKLNIPDSYSLCTIHRAENTNDLNKLKSIIEALQTIGLENNIVIPIHPRTKQIIIDNEIDVSNLILIEPVGYLEMVWLIDNSKLIITDSGGLQKEAYFFDKYCITLRKETEWIELVKGGFNSLVGVDKDLIIKTYHEYINLVFESNEEQFYGDGNTCKKIIKELLK